MNERMSTNMERRFWLALWALAVLGGISGCAFFHDLQPHRLHRLNRQPAPALDPEFTVVDQQFARQLS